VSPPLLRREERHQDRVAAQSLMLEVRPQQPLANEAAPLRRALRADVLRLDEDLEPLEAEFVEGPVREQPKTARRDPPPAGGCGDPAADRPAPGTAIHTPQRDPAEQLGGLGHGRDRERDPVATALRRPELPRQLGTPRIEADSAGR
jgi:hypothetical protein